MMASDDFDARLEVARFFIYADIDKACADERERTREAAEHARRSLGQSFRWVVPHSRRPR